jgi:hypothetical protein
MNLVLMKIQEVTRLKHLNTIVLDFKKNRSNISSKRKPKLPIKTFTFVPVKIYYHLKTKSNP